MTIETIIGSRKYRQNPARPSEVQVQHKHGARWVTYAIRDGEKEARELILQLAKEATERQEPKP